MPDSHDLEALLLTHIQPFENLTHSTNTCSIPLPPFQHSDLLRNSFLLNEKEGKKLHPYNSQVSSSLAAVGMIFNSFCIKLLLSCHFISDYPTQCSQILQQVSKSLLLSQQSHQDFMWAANSLNLWSPSENSSDIITRVFDSCLSRKTFLETSRRGQPPFFWVLLWMDWWAESCQSMESHVLKGNSWVLENCWQQNWNYWSFIGWEGT